MFRVADLMHTGDAVPRVRAEAPLEDALVEMTKKRLGMTTVVDAEGRLLGIITDGDLRRLHLRTPSFGGVRAADVASGEPKTIAADDLAAKALEVMEAWAITSLVVIDPQRRPQGVIHMHDILRAKIV
jgi:arabinose-5-phosphate isomerase